MERKVKQVLALVILGLVIVGFSYGVVKAHEATYEDVHIRYKIIEEYKLGYYKQGEKIRVRVVINEGSVKVLEGRVAEVMLFDSDNKANFRKGLNGVPVATLNIDTKKKDEGTISYTAHRDDTYYLVYRNDDCFNLTLKVADTDALDTQLFLKVFWCVVLAVIIIVFCWAYGRLFEVNVRQVLGLVRRWKGPGSKAAVEPREEVPEEGVIESDAGGEGPGSLP